MVRILRGGMHVHGRARVVTSSIRLILLVSRLGLVEPASRRVMSTRLRFYCLVDAKFLLTAIKRLSERLRRGFVETSIILILLRKILVRILALRSIFTTIVGRRIVRWVRMRKRSIMWVGVRRGVRWVVGRAMRRVVRRRVGPRGDHGNRHRWPLRLRLGWRWTRLAGLGALGVRLLSWT